MDCTQQKKIKLLLIIDFLGGLTGGTENQLVKLINNLPKSKYDIYLLSFWKTTWITNNRKYLDCHVSIYDIIKLKNPLNIIRIFLVFKYIKSINPDIAMTFFPLSNTVGVIIARLAHVKVILSTRRDYGLWLQNKLGVYFLKIANRFVTRIIANSHKVGMLTSREECFDLSKIDVIYNGFDAKPSQWHQSEGTQQLSTASIQKKGPIVGIIGGLKPMKRHYTFIKAAKIVLLKRNDVKFIIVGDGPCKKQLEAITDELKLKDHIYFAGSQDNITPYLSLFDIGVNCSSNEGLSNAIIEYMAGAVPCIVSKAGGNEELINNGINGFTFELDNDRELANLIITLLDNKKKQQEFVRQSKEFVLKYLTLEKIITEYDNYFSKLLKGTIS